MATTGSQLEKSAPGGVAMQATLVERLRALGTMAQLRWTALEPGQRRAAVAAALMLATLLAAALWYGLRTEWRTLYTNLEPADQRQVTQILTTARIPFELTSDGAGVRVPAAQLDKARLATAAKGSLKSGRMGFEIFDKPNWVGSEFDEQVNYQRALEGELEHTLGGISDIESARVHLVLPHDSLFRESERPAKASVELKLKRRTLAEGEPEAIRNLVAAAVDGLTPERVVLVDADGRAPLGLKTPESERLEAEEALERKLVATLEPVTGRGNVRASVTLDYTSAASEETNESYDPQKTAPLTMQRSEQTSAPRQAATGVTGAASNAPNAQAVLPVYPQQMTGAESAKSESGTYAVSKVVRRVEEKPGKLRRMTAAILVNDRLVQAGTKTKAAQWQTRSAGELQNLTTLAQAAVGFEAARGDLLAVSDLPFDANRPTPPPPMLSQWLAQAESAPQLLRYAAMMLALLAILTLGVRPAVMRARGEPAGREKAGKGEKGKGEKGKGKSKELGGEGSGGGGELDGQGLSAALEPPEPDPERLRNQEIFDQVSSFLKRDPTQSSRLLQSWIHSDQ